MSTEQPRIPGSRREGETNAQWTRRVWTMGWVPACGGTERPITDRLGRRLLYCVDLMRSETAYIDMDTDMPVDPDFTTTY